MNNVHSRLFLLNQTYSRKKGVQMELSAPRRAPFTYDMERSGMS